MPEPTDPDLPLPDAPDWFLKEWAKLKGKRQADLVKVFGWTKNTAHKLWHSKQDYSRAKLNDVAAWLEIEPYELLMRPKDALMLRRLREVARAVLAEEEDPFRHNE